MLLTTTEKLVQFSLVLFVLITFNGCGFHLRNQHCVPAGIHCIKIIGAPRDLESSLKRSLERMGVQVQRSDGNAPIVIQIFNSSLYQDVPTIGGSNQARIYVYYFQALFGINDASGKVLLAPQMVKTSETLIINAGTTQESTAQLEILKLQIQEEAAHMIINGLTAIPAEKSAEIAP